MEGDVALFVVTVRDVGDVTLVVRDDDYIILRNGEKVPGCQWSQSQSTRALHEFRRMAATGVPVAAARQ